MGQCVSSVSDEARNIIRGHKLPVMHHSRHNPNHSASRSRTGDTIVSGTSSRNSNGTKTTSNNNKSSKNNNKKRKNIPSKRETIKANIDLIPSDIDFNEGCVLLSIVVDVWRQTGFHNSGCDLSSFWKGFVVSYKVNKKTNGRLTKLKFGNMNMTYELPAIVSRLQELTSLNLVNCTYLPVELSQLTKLEELLLISCQNELFLNLPDFQTFHATNNNDNDNDNDENNNNCKNTNTNTNTNTTSAFVGLKSISLQASHFLQPKVFTFVTKQLPHLEKLCVRWENKDESSKVFKALLQDDVDECCAFRHTLKSLYVGYCYLDENDVTLLHSNILPKYPQLYSIVVPSNRIGDLREVEDKVKANSKLRLLTAQARSQASSSSQAARSSSSQQLSDHDATSNVSVGNSNSSGGKRSSQQLSDHDASSDVSNSGSGSNSAGNNNNTNDIIINDTNSSNNSHNGDHDIEVYSACDNSSIGTFDEYKLHEEDTKNNEKEPSFFVTNEEFVSSESVASEKKKKKRSITTNNNNKDKDTASSSSVTMSTTTPDKSNNTITTTTTPTNNKNENNLDKLNFYLDSTSPMTYEDDDDDDDEEEKNNGYKNEVMIDFEDEKKKTNSINDNDDDRYHDGLSEGENKSDVHDDNNNNNNNEKKVFDKVFVTKNYDDNDDEVSIPKSLQLFVHDIDETFIESKNAYWA